MQKVPLGAKQIASEEKKENEKTIASYVFLHAGYHFILELRASISMSTECRGLGFQIFGQRTKLKLVIDRGCVTFAD